MLFKNKADWITRFINGKNVLDLGCVRHDLDETTKPEWLHGIILKHARSVHGVDYLQKEVLQLQKQGYNVTCANVETMSLGEKYEVVVAGDLIEHLSNFGLFMERIVAHLEPGGIALITTPNPVNFLRFASVLFRGVAGANPEHTCWFTEQVLRQLGERYGLEVSDVAYVDDSYQYYNKYKWWPFFLINYLLCRLRHQFSETLCVAFKVRN